MKRPLLLAAAALLAVMLCLIVPLTVAKTSFSHAVSTIRHGGLR